MISNLKKLKFVNSIRPRRRAPWMTWMRLRLTATTPCISGLTKTRKGILVEKPGPEYVNYIVVREKDKNAAWVKTLVKSYQDPSVRAFVNKSYKGSVIANF